MNVSQLPENVTDIAVLVQCAGQGDDSWCGGTTDSVTARDAQFQFEEAAQEDRTQRMPIFAGCGDNAINNSFFRSLSHAQQT